MRLSRTDLLPVLTIVAGGVIGASFSAGIIMPNLLLMSCSGYVPIPDPIVAPTATAELEMPRISGWILGPDPLRRDIATAVAIAEGLAREQRDIEVGMDRVAEARVGPNSDPVRSLMARKNTMHDEIMNLWPEIQRLTGEARTDQREASDRLDDAATTIDDDKLPERIRYSLGLIGIRDREYTREFEAETTRLVEELLEGLRSARGALLSTPMRVTIY